VKRASRQHSGQAAASPRKRANQARNKAAYIADAAAAAAAGMTVAAFRLKRAEKHYPTVYHHDPDDFWNLVHHRSRRR